MRKTMALAAAAGVAALASHAGAVEILSFGFTDLVGTYNHGAGMFSVVDGADTSGDVTRIEAPSSSAFYNVGFSGGTASATFMVSVFNKVGNLAQGAGTFTIVDADGDELTGDITGTWIGGALGIFFNGDLSNVSFNLLGNGMFDGPSGGSFDPNFSGTPPYSGAIVQLFIPPSGNFFNSDFTVETVQVLGEIVPAPSALALLGVAGLVSARRRRN
ncbi:MAG: PEP-CTERM sorting domain-containing protein [Phycisphaeraceae bacterium]|nr:PEP-CTERM sorting domain-containing protein [Phycisphaeraceae bacterium]